MENIAVDSLAELFERNAAGEYVQLRRFFIRHSAETCFEDDWLALVKRLVTGRTRQSLFRIFRERDPEGAKLWRNIKLAVAGDKRYDLAVHLGREWIHFRRKKSAGTQNKIRFLQADHNRNTGGLFAQFQTKDTIPVLLQKKIKYHEECGESDPVLEVREIARLIRSYRTGFQWKSPQSAQEPFAEDGSLVHLEGKIERIKEGLFRKLDRDYLNKGKMDPRLVDGMTSALSALIEDMLCGNGTEPYYYYIQTHLPSVGREDYRVRIRTKFEYFAKLIRNDIKDAIRRNLDTLYTKPVSSRHYQFQFSIAEKEAAFYGNSLEAPLALLMASGAVNAFYGSPLVAFDAGTVVTGGIDPQARLLGVDDDGSSAKIEAAFFSPVRCVVVPWQNLKPAMKTVETLRRRYPNRRLILESAENLEQLGNDRSLVIYRKPGIRVTWVSGFRRNRDRVLQAAAILLLWTALAWLLRGVAFKDRDPATCTVAGSSLNVRNASGEDLWKHDLGFRLTERFYTGSDQHKAVLEDIDQDAKKELLFGIYENQFPGRSGRLFVFDHNGKMSCTLNTGREMVFGGETFADHYRIAFADAVDFGGDGRREVFALGQNNEYRCAVMAVLKPFDMNGASPQTPGGHYGSNGIATGKELFYLRFPQSMATPLAGGRDSAIEMVENNAGYELAVSNGTVDPRFLIHSRILIYNPGKDLSLKGVSGTDSYARFLTKSQIHFAEAMTRLRSAGILYFSRP